MTASLTYNLPEETDEFDAAFQALSWKKTARELDIWLRNEIKHGDGSAYISPIEALQVCRTRLSMITAENGLDLYE